MRKGFTLIELLVVISIVAFLSSIVLAQLNSARDKGRLAAARSFSAQAFRVAADQAVGIWDFEDGSGTVAADRSGNGNNGVLTNMVPTWSTDTYSGNGRSIQFDGTNDFIEVPYSATLAPTTAISFGAWFKMNNISAEQRILSKTESGGYQLGINEPSCPNSICAFLYSGGYHLVTYSLSNFSTGKWYYALVTYDGDTLRLYIDGREVATNTNPSGNIGYSTNNVLCIGAEPTGVCSGGLFNGFLDEVRIYAKSLTAAEVGRLYAEGLSRLAKQK